LLLGELRSRVEGLSQKQRNRPVAREGRRERLNPSRDWAGGEKRRVDDFAQGALPDDTSRYTSQPRRAP